MVIFSHVKISSFRAKAHLALVLKNMPPCGYCLLRDGNARQEIETWPGSKETNLGVV